MWEIDFAEQIKSFFYSIILGGIFGLLYDTFQIPLKRKGVSPIAVFIADIIYFVIIGITNFLFLLGVSKGEIRGYLLIGAAFGFFLYKKTLSRPIGFIFFIVTKPVRLLFFLAE